MTPRKGLYFEHSRWLDPLLPIEQAKTARHRVFVITKIARGTVYYRAVYSQHPDRLEYGAPWKCSLDEFSRYARQELNASEFERKKGTHYDRNDGRIGAGRRYGRRKSFDASSGPGKVESKRFQ